MVPDPVQWWWCLRNPLAAGANDCLFDWLEGRDFVVKFFFDQAWTVAGGTVDDPIYAYFVEVFQLEYTVIPNPPFPPFEAYLLGPEWWNAVVDAIINVPPSEQICPMPEWE